MILPAVTIGWDPLGWVHDMEWYRELLRADWFQPIRPVWVRYHLDWVAAGLLLLILVLVMRALWRRRRFRRRAPDGRRSRKLSRKAAEHYAATGEPMLAVEAYRRAGDDEAALQLLVEQRAWALAAALAEEMGQPERAIGWYMQAKDTGGAVQMLVGCDRIDEAADLLRAEDRTVDAANLYLEKGQPVRAAWLFREVGLFAKAAAVFFEQGEQIQAAECLLQLMNETQGEPTEDESELLLQGAASLQQAGRTLESAHMLRVAGEFEGAARRYEQLDERAAAAACYRQLGKLRRALALTDAPQERLQLIQHMRAQGLPVDERELAAAMRAAGQHDQAAEKLLELGDVDAAVTANLDSGNLAEAAALLAEAGRHAEAGRIFERGGDLLAAREQHLLAGDRLAAAEAALRADLPFEAGRDFLAAGALERAIDALQRVETDHVEQRTAASLLGQAFAGLGDVAMARRMHERAVAGLDIERERLELFYQLARFLEATGEPADRDRAARLYADMLAVHYGFRDVKQRRDRLVVAGSD